MTQSQAVNVGLALPGIGQSFRWSLDLSMTDSNLRMREGERSKRES